MINIDFLLAALWLALIIRNKAAVLPLIALIIDCLLWVYLDGIYRCLITACFYFVSSCIKWTPDYLRPSLLVAGSLYWLAAADEMVYDILAISTVYFDVMPYLIIAINAYIAAVLFSQGGGQIVGLTKRPYRLVNRRWLGL